MSAKRSIDEHVEWAKVVLHRLSAEIEQMKNVVEYEDTPYLNSMQDKAHKLLTHLLEIERFNKSTIEKK